MRTRKRIRKTLEAAKSKGGNPSATRN
eukprot:COSAG04_NODE_27109_length_286_cov_1.363636_1_plen_26_part_10